MAFALSFTPHGSLSATEARALVAHNGSLYCGTGQWCETAPISGPQIIRLDSAGGEWKLETEFALDPVNRIAVACLAELHFPTANLTTLVAGFFGGSAVAVKNGQGQWIVTRIGNGTGQIRSFTAHKDSVTHVDMAFAGSDQGIFSGVYDSDLPGEIQWAATPELDIAGFPLMARGHPQRVMSFAELRGILYTTIGQDLWQRIDGGHSAWRKVWANPLPGVSQSGLRGMTPVDGNLWVGVEGTEGRIVSVDAGTWESHTEIDLSGPRDYYVIVAYNNMCLIDTPAGKALLAGLDGKLDGPAHYFSFYNGIWTRRTIPPVAPQPMVSTRTICPSPFNATDIYFAGHDCNGQLARNTAWVAVSTIDGAI